MSKFRKKPVVIEAHRTDVEISIETLEGTMIASPGDYIITGVKGEKYPCKPDIFEATYEPVISGPVMNFGQALEELKAGKRVARAGWNGKGMWICYMPALYLDKDIINGRTKKHIGEGVDLDSQPYLVMWTAQGKWQPGWLASQTDMLAEDWEVV